MTTTSSPYIRYTQGVTLSNASPETLQRAAWDIYRNDYAGYVRNLIWARFDDETASLYTNFLNPVQNPLRRIARLLSVTYTIPVYRTSKNNALDRVVREKLVGLDTALGEAEALKNACADAFVVPWYNKRKKRIDFNVFPPHEWKVEIDEATSEIVYYEHLEAVRYYTDGSVSRKDKRGDWPAPSPMYPVCPVVWFRLNPYSRETWGVEAVRDLINGTIEIGMSETLNNFGDYYRSFKQIYLDTDSTLAQKDNEMKTVRIGPHMVSRQRLATVEMADAKNEYYDAIRKKIADLASTRGISETAYYSQEETLVFSPELRKIWRESTKYQLEPERELLNASVGLLGLYEGGIPDPKREWHIDYREPIPEEADPGKAVEILEKQVRNGVGSAVDFVLKNDREIVTREEAEDRIKRNAEDRAMVVELMRELNAPAEQGNPGKTPQENGSIGGQISAEVRGEYDGARGPSILPPDM